MNLPLNINWQQIILHLFNFVVLFAILYFLLYKPVKDFMEKRTEYYKKLDDDANTNLEVAERTKMEYKEKLSKADEEISEKKELARKASEEESAIIIKQAEKKAEKIIKEARQTSELEHDKMIKEAQNEIAEMVVSATEKIVLQAGTAESFDQFLNTVERSGANE